MKGFIDLGYIEVVYMRFGSQADIWRAQKRKKIRTYRLGSGNWVVIVNNNHIRLEVYCKNLCAKGKNQNENTCKFILRY